LFKKPDKDNKKVLGYNGLRWWDGNRQPAGQRAVGRLPETGSRWSVAV